jgi:branched-chain amino acid transport system permease protein
MGNVYGVILGAIVLQYLNVAGLDKIGTVFNDLFGTNETVFAQYKFLIFGLLLVIMMLVRPEGILPSARRKAELHEAEEEGEFGPDEDLYDARREGV